MDEWKEQEEMRMKEQMESMRASFLEDIDKMKKKEASYQKASQLRGTWCGSPSKSGKWLAGNSYKAR